MAAKRIRVAVNGYGVIGKRVADAVARQDDMELVGVADVMSDYRIRVAAERGYDIYASMPDKRSEMEAAGLPIVGTLDDLLKQVDIVVDATPKGIGAKNKATYERHGVKAIWQGGEKHDLAGFSFCAQVNYEQALGRQYARVVSCNTTGLCRIMNALHKRRWIRRARAVLLRRGTDPWESHKNGMINTVIPETTVPSHQGPDAQTVMEGLNITTLAGAGPYNLSHIHYCLVETTRPISKEELRMALVEEPRVAFVRAADGLVALNAVIELMRDLERPRHDMWEVAVWEDALAADDTDVYITFQVDNESIAIPENIDCIRALTMSERDPLRSIQRTNASLGITKNYLPKTMPMPELEHLGAAEIAHVREGYKGSEEPVPTGPKTY
ncbi:MAG: type II glyceraldehyde-3-phosphate dehydrogenase [Anaerolineae bacterium]